MDMKEAILERCMLVSERFRPVEEPKEIIVENMPDYRRLMDGFGIE